MRILMALEATRSPAFCAASRRGNRSSSSPGRMAGARRNEPPGVPMRSSAGRGLGHVRQRIDVESADDARIQALEIEHPDVAVQARDRTRARARPAEPRARWSRRSAPWARRYRASRARSDRRSRRRQCWLRLDPASFPPADCARRPIEPDPASSRCRRRVAHRCARRGRTPADRGDSCAWISCMSIPRIAFDGLAFSEHAACHGIERIVLHAHKGAAQEIDPIQHDAAGYGGLPAPEVALGLADADGCRHRDPD